MRAVAEGDAGRDHAMQERAPAKLNLFLHVLGRRPDGRHDLDSLAVFPDFGDSLSVGEADDLSVRYVGPQADAVRQTLPAGQRDLVTRAAQAIAARCGRRADVALRVEKRIPVAAGLGGGSADAAAALRLLNRYWRAGLSEADLHALALELGADVPVCLRSRCLRMSGIGDRLVPARLDRDYALVLFNPGIPVSTAEVFARCVPGERGREAVAPSPCPVTLADLRAGTNDLQRPAIDCAPALAAMLRRAEACEEALLVRMSGSGATCFALTDTPSAAARIEAAVQPLATWTRICRLAAGEDV